MCNISEAMVSINGALSHSLSEENTALTGVKTEESSPAGATSRI